MHNHCYKWHSLEWCGLRWHWITHLLQTSYQTFTINICRNVPLTMHTVHGCTAEICMYTEWGCKHARMNAEQGRESTRNIKHMTNAFMHRTIWRSWTKWLLKLSNPHQKLKTCDNSSLNSNITDRENLLHASSNCDTQTLELKNRFPPINICFS